MVNPPELVELDLESICLILNQETSDWKVIRDIILKENFILQIPYQEDTSIQESSSIIFVAIVKKPSIEFVWLSSESEDEANEVSSNQSGQISRKSSLCTVPKESLNENLNDTVNDDSLNFYLYFFLYIFLIKLFNIV
ncbi:cytoplasmic dynein 1 heavy chain 1 isoform X2 [Brachionus plicatilis]|uniref:Cytoplasmic dynein 1 heavy chain 1 isoform X2 n=1 Tax=Brachionus plicatilis TaxID=10195 RepID=A0A3M7RAA3_BRAPC|nr:cytoplasmic dynein 1 heavy chain 1 isoform X2 [Brachionus plicatilis]